ncbi:hypothetical protein POTOM_029580 [Populus tomentosa]|uniref:Uncharacterized protein n=1 Tax=Populus tomentosa TaxID=118781 RepID=A0A8X8CT14_POPTO|nr:hypothetical protein POTOM_029580 [Populus tomentosa]
MLVTIGCLGNPGNVNGSWLVGFSGFSGGGSNLSGELQAIRHGLQPAWDRGCRNRLGKSVALNVLAVSQLLAALLMLKDHPCGVAKPKATIVLLELRCYLIVA